MAVVSRVPGDGEVAELPELLGLGIVARGRLIEDIGTGALEDGHVVVRDVVSFGDDEHPDGFVVTGLVHHRRIVIVLGPLDLRGLDLLVVELGGHCLRTGVGVDTGPPQLPAKEERDNETSGDEQLTDPGQDAIEDSYHSALARRSVSYKTPSTHHPSSQLRHHRVSGQSKATCPEIGRAHV